MAANEHMSVSEPFVALRGTDETGTLYFYERTRESLNFDPEAPGPVAPVFEPWDLYSPDETPHWELTSELTSKFNLSPEQFFALRWLANCGNSPEFISQIAEVMSGINAQERSNQDDALSQDAQAAQHPESSPGSNADRDHP